MKCPHCGEPLNASPAVQGVVDENMCKCYGDRNWGICRVHPLAVQDAQPDEGKPPHVKGSHGGDRGGYVWAGEGPEPAKWWASDGTLVYRSYADYCDD